MGEQPVTPPRSHKPLETQSDTPFVRKATRDSSHLSETLPASRQTVLADLGYAVPEVSVAFFFENVCPRISSRDDSLVDKVLSRLTTGSNKIIDDETGRWADFAITPRKSSKREDPTFKPLENLIKAIGDAAVSEDPAFISNFVFENSPHVSPASDHWNSSSRPDGCFRVRGPGKGGETMPHWKDIALSAEYKKYTLKETRDDVVAKVIWGMHHSMREDPRRRFTFGLTIEDSQMRLWYASRADVMVTETFDFLTDHRSVIYLALAFLSADPQDVGYDPTMTALLDKKGNPLLDPGDKPRFDITVHAEDGKPVVFRTKRLISFIGTAALQGRGTRVWEARRINRIGREYGDTVILKDCWVDSDRFREGTIMKMIRESAASEEGRKVLDEHLLTVIFHGDVQVEEGVRDHTRELMTNGKDISLESGEFLLRTPSDSQTQKATAGTGRNTRRAGTHPGPSKKQSPGVKCGSNTAPKGDAGHHHGNEPPPEDKQHRYYQYHPKAHYRIVFKEVCDVLHQETSLIPLFRYLSQTALVLQFLHEAGWVHRDLSTGNILIFKGKVKLADFEYAKQLDEQTDAHDIRTGTADFISVEVDRQEYFFASSNSISSAELAAMMQAEDEDLQDLQQEVPQPEVVFRYNPMHDFESLWWISVHILFNKRVVMVNERIPPYHDYQKQLSWAAGVFYGLAARQSALSAGTTDFQSAIKTLCPALRRFGTMVNALRADLLKRYIKIEADLLNLPRRAAAGELPRQFIVGFGALGCSKSNGRHREILISPVSREVLKVSTKPSASPEVPEEQLVERKGGPVADPARMMSHPLGQQYLERLPPESRVKIQTRSMTAKARAQDPTPKTQ